LSVPARVFAFFRVLWRFLRAPVLIGLGFAIGFVVPYAARLDREVRARFDDLSWEIPSRVYARPLQLAPGLALTADILKIELDAARYVEDPAAKTRAGTDKRGFRGRLGRVYSGRVARGETSVVRARPDRAAAARIAADQR